MFADMDLPHPTVTSLGRNAATGSHELRAPSTISYLASYSDVEREKVEKSS
jgi:hypothetical protein